MNITTVFGPPPAGINLDDDRTLQDNAVVATICALAILTVILRYFVRLYIQGAKVEVDDYLVGASIIPLVALLSISLLGTLNFAISWRDIDSKQAAIMALVNTFGARPWRIWSL